MHRRSKWNLKRGGAAVALLLCSAALWVLVAGRVPLGDLDRASQGALRSPVGSPQLISIEPLPMPEGEICQWLPASASASEALFQQTTAAGSAGAVGRTSVGIDRAPVRVIRDTYPTYSAIAQDAQTGDIFLQDENLFGIKVFDRLTNTPANAAFSEPKRMLGGHNTKLEFNCGLYIDPKTGDIYSVNNDTTDMLVIFDRDAEGDVPPSRELRTPHGTYGIAVDEAKQEMYLTVEHVNSIVVYKKAAQGTEQPLRTIAGSKTQLEDPHGISLDTKNGLILVTNHGNAREGQDVKYGKFEAPSITVYPLSGQGDVAPLRIIEGPKTRLNWPAHLWVDEQRDEFYVANDADDSILVFGINDSGDVAPRRMIRGPKTQIRNPMGVFLDQKNNELWVSNMGNHRATVYDRTADGDIAPKRVVRSAPPEKIAQAIGNPGAVGYDSKREEVLVPN
jgi:DNA-binding beta-propeller fold protein YncE